jgi:hypothetical protein
VYEKVVTSPVLTVVGRLNVTESLDWACTGARTEKRAGIIRERREMYMTITEGERIALV